MVTTLTPGSGVTMVGLTLEGTQMFQSSKQSQAPAHRHLTSADVGQPFTFRDTGSLHSEYYFECGEKQAQGLVGGKQCLAYQVLRTLKSVFSQPVVGDF